MTSFRISGARNSMGACMILILLFFVLHTLHALETVKQFGPGGKKASQVFPPRNLDGRYVSLSAAVQSVDVSTNIASLSWKIDGDSCMGNLQASPQSDCADVNIYIPSNLLMAGDISSTNLVATNSPTFVWNITAFLSTGWQLSPFQTSMALMTGTASTILYPFDHYDIPVILFAITAGSPVYVQILRADFSVASYVIHFTDMNTNATTNQQYAQYKISVSRCLVVKAYVIFLMVTTWLTTAALGVTTMASVLFGYRLPTEILLVPVGALFAFSQLRSSLPSLPDVSLVDYICFQPCLGMLEFSAVLSIVGVSWDPEHRRSLFNKIFRRRPAQVAEAEAGDDHYELMTPPEQVNSHGDGHSNGVV